MFFRYYSLPPLAAAEPVIVFESRLSLSLSIVLASLDIYVYIYIYIVCIEQRERRSAGGINLRKQNFILFFLKIIK